MSYSNYKQIESAIEWLKPFEGNSATGSWSGGKFEVRSYGTLIAYCHPADFVCWVSPSYYSKTTSRLQNIIRRVWEV